MDSTRKCRWRHQEAERVRKNRVTQGYIEKKYPEIYNEALEFYGFLHNKYPNKKDLRRTNEYEWVKTGIPGESSKKYYSRNKTRTTTTTTTTTVSDRMELIIPLMSNDSVPSSQVQQPPDSVPSLQVQQPPVNEQHAEMVPSVIDTTDNEIPQIMATLNEEIPDHIIQDIMAELRSDPDMNKFFSDINEGFDEEELICS